MVPSEYDVGDASGTHAVAIGTVDGKHRVILSAWETEEMDNLSCIALSPERARSLASALIRAADNAPPDWPQKHAALR